MPDGVETGVVSQERFSELPAVAEGDDAGDHLRVLRIESDVLERPVDESGTALGPGVPERGRVSGSDLRGEVRAEQVHVGVARRDGPRVLPVQGHCGAHDLDRSDDAHEFRGLTFQARGVSRAAFEHAGESCARVGVALTAATEQHRADDGQDEEPPAKDAPSASAGFVAARWLHADDRDLVSGEVKYLRATVAPGASPEGVLARVFRADRFPRVTVSGVSASPRSPRLRLLLPLLVLAPAALISVGVFAFRGGSSEASLSSQLEACVTNDCVVAVLLDGLAAEGPTEVLEAYRGIEPDSGGSIDCHDATHRLGEEAFRVHGLDAWVPGGNVCNFGFYHGFMVGASADASLTEFERLAHELCDDVALPETDLPGEECVHGFGHAVFHLTGSLPGAVERCTAFGDDRYRRRCNEGAVKDGLMVKPAVTDEDFAACGLLGELDQGTCVYVTAAYAVVRARDLAAVPSVCAPQPAGELRRECEEGLGRGVSMRAVGERFTTPGVWAGLVCGDSVDCAYGFGRSVYFIRNDEAWSKSECSVFAGGLRVRCEEGVSDAPRAG